MKVWAYINEHGILCCALFPEAVPSGVNAVELEVDDPVDVVLDNGQIRVKTAEEKLNELKQIKLQLLRSYLTSLLFPTDYVLIKIQEAQVAGGDVNALLQKYEHVLNKRQAIREWYRQTKQAILNATSQEELNSINLEFRE